MSDLQASPADEGPGDLGAHDLQTIRQELGLSAAQLATFAGVSEVELAEMEDGRRPVPPTLLAELMEQLNAKGA
jgi:predicted transcriptional regulator